MRVLKFHNKIIGADLTKAEEEALTRWCERYIDKHLAAITREHWQEIDAMFLWTLHEHTGWGPKRLWDFYLKFHEPMDDMIERYELDDNAEDRAWICTHKLKEYGIDIKEWHERATKEREKNGKQGP